MTLWLEACETQTCKVWCDEMCNMRGDLSINGKLTRPLKKCNTAFSLVRRREEDCWGEVARWPRNDPCGHGHGSQIKQFDKYVRVCARGFNKIQLRCCGTRVSKPCSFLFEVFYLLTWADSSCWETENCEIIDDSYEWGGLQSLKQLSTVICHLPCLFITAQSQSKCKIFQKKSLVASGGSAWAALILKGPLPTHPVSSTQVFSHLPLRVTRMKLMYFSCTALWAHLFHIFISYFIQYRKLHICYKIKR